MPGVKPGVEVVGGLFIGRVRSGYFIQRVGLHKSVGIDKVENCEYTVL